MGKKVVIIGLDGGTLDVIRPMIQSGELPNMAAMSLSHIQLLRSTEL